MTQDEKIIEEFLEKMAELNPDALYPKDLKAAIVGYVERIGDEPLIVMNREKCLEILATDGTCETMEDAIEWFDYNVIGAYSGTGTPVFLTTVEDAVTI